MGKIFIAGVSLANSPGGSRIGGWAVVWGHPYRSNGPIGTMHRATRHRAILSALQCALETPLGQSGDVTMVTDSQWLLDVTQNGYKVPGKHGFDDLLEWLRERHGTYTLVLLDKSNSMDVAMMAKAYDRARLAVSTQ